MSQRIYLDYNATTPLSKLVKAELLRLLELDLGNPSSRHWACTPAAEIVELSRIRIAALIGCDPTEILFTSGGAEANYHEVSREINSQSRLWSDLRIVGITIYETTCTKCRLMSKLILMGLFSSLLSFLAGCSEKASPIGTPVGVMTDRKLGFGVTEGDIGYEHAFAMAKNAGIQFIELPQQWDEVETTSENYESPFAAMANEVYPKLDTALVISMNPIDTGTHRVPEHLLHSEWDSIERVEAFKRWFDWTKSQLPDAEIIAVSVGNEVDVYFASHPDEVEAYARFFKKVATHIREQLPDAAVGCKMTFSGRKGELGQALTSIDSQADAIMLTYYPLDDQFLVRDPSEVSRDFKLMAGMSEKPIYLLETGYPSGVACQSSEIKQAAFIDALFESWDEHVGKITLVNLVWTCDLPKPQVDSMVQYYGVKQLAFREYLETLGLLTADGVSKPAFDRVRESVRMRVKLR